MSAAHTPGPWAIFHDHPDPVTATSLGYIRSVDHDKGAWNSWGFSEIATCYGCEEPEQAANARLIAAAPVLLQQLQHLVRWHDQLSAADLNGARAAIAAATGGAS